MSFLAWQPFSGQKTSTYGIVSTLTINSRSHFDLPCLASFRIFRLLLKQGNPNSHMQVMKQDILKPILDLTIQESLRDNLLSCSCQEYFEHMRKVRLHP
jgi:hypothetical protein